jgi:hypothetical protein
MKSTEVGVQINEGLTELQFILIQILKPLNLIMDHTPQSQLFYF